MNSLRRFLVASIAAFALQSTAVLAAELSPTEQKLVAEVRSRSPAALQLLERSVNINSGAQAWPTIHAQRSPSTASREPSTNGAEA